MTCIQEQRPTTEWHAPDVGHANTECGGVKYVWWRKIRPLNWDRIVTGQDKSKLYKSIEKVLTHQIDTKQTHNLRKHRSGVVEQTTTKKLLSRDLRVFYLLAPSLKQITINREKAFKVIKTFSYGVIHV